MTLQELHDDKVSSLAESYRNEGYEVIVEPSPAMIPGFSANLQPDLLVRKGDNQIVVEVKSLRGLRDSDAVRQMADALAKSPDWKFELVILDDAVAEVNQTLGPDLIAAQLSSAESLLRQGQPASAFMIAWISLEALLRRLVGAHRLEIGDASPVRLIRELAFHGLLSQEDFEKLSEKFRLRNQVVHGFNAPTLSHRDVEQIIDIAQRLRVAPESETAAA